MTADYGLPGLTERDNVLVGRLGLRILMLAARPSERGDGFSPPLSWNLLVTSECVVSHAMIHFLLLHVSWLHAVGSKVSKRLTSDLFPIMDRKKVASLRGVNQLIPIPCIDMKGSSPLLHCHSHQQEEQSMNITPEYHASSNWMHSIQNGGVLGTSYNI